MKNIYEKWDNRISPALGLLTNNYVNYYTGVSITQSTVSPPHVLPSSFSGKKFHINNEGSSTYNITISVITSGGATTFSVTPGNSVIFVYTGNNVWDQIGGQDIITSFINGIRREITRIIQFSDIPDIGPATYTIGKIPTGAAISNIVVDISTPFNDPLTTTLQIEAVSGAQIIFDAAEIDIQQNGVYETTHHTLTNTITGDVTAVFNSIPNAAGGTQGQVGVIITYITV